MLSNEEHKELLKTARSVRHSVIDTTLKAGGAHVGGGMSMLDIMVMLYFKQMKIDVNNPDDPDRDRFVLCSIISINSSRLSECTLMPTKLQVVMHLPVR